MTLPAPSDDLWISRCLDLARLGIGNVSPNPPVGAVLVFENKIIGEGFHSVFGGPHAEVQAFRNVNPADRHLLPKATLYVSLEPCCITGKTPPCTDLILQEGVKHVRIAIPDPNPAISGKGIEILKSNGVEVFCGILEKEAQELIRPFKTNILHHRPYVILKWAQSMHGFIGRPDELTWLSDPYSSIWTHSLRSKADAIMVGARTIMLDDPELTTRDYPGKSPHRVIYDPNGALTSPYKVFNKDQRRIFYFSLNNNPNVQDEHISRYILNDHKPEVEQILSVLYSQQIGILMVEGGAYVHELFIQQNAWDEACVIQTKHSLNNGIKAPVVRGKLSETLKSGTDEIVCILNE